tara:strand:+ start:606 stop:959 length:354 start_codon:yes stop_codon:yes gene_type:complete
MNTNYINLKDAEFVATGSRLAYRDGKDLHWSLLYLPTEAALSWDKPFADLGGIEGCRDKGFAMALGSQHGGYRYVLVKETGRVETRVELSAGARGVRCQVVFDNDPSGEPLRGWMVK